MTKLRKKYGWNTVFLLSAITSILIALWGMLDNASMDAVASRLMQFLKDHASWLYLSVMLLFILFSFGLAFSKWGNIRLGRDDERPEYSTVSWFAMLFGAGMGIGLVFWSIAEPLSHYMEPMKGITPQTVEAQRFAVRSCFMHWGLHPWACYAVMGLGLAYFQFRRQEPGMVSNLIKPLLVRRASNRVIATAVDVYTTVLTITGVAASFGMGCLQICEGMHFLFGIPNKVYTWLVVIILICIVYLKSAISGVGKGIKLLSDINLVLFLMLLCLGFWAGSEKDTIALALTGVKDYLVHFFPDSLRLSAQGDRTWIQNWRVFYWAWWLGWTPFVGIFIARISRGRTIREFVLGVIAIPTVVSVIWFSVFSGLTFQCVDLVPAEELAVIAATPETALFHIFDQYSLGPILSVFTLCLLVTFFITSANSATFVLSMLTSEGRLDPPNRRKIFWGIVMAAMAFALILSGGISMIQTVSTVIAFPYLFILLLICVSLVLALRKDTAPKSDLSPEKEGCFPKLQPSESAKSMTL